MYYLLFCLLCLYNLLTRLQEYGEEVVENLIMVCIAFMWLTQPSELRYKDVPSVLAIVAAIKFSSLIDRESNEPDMRLWVGTNYPIV